MTAGKTATLTIRIEPALKEAVRAAAEKEHRSIANMIEIMIRQYCSHSEIEISDHLQMPARAKKGSKPVR